MPTATAAPHKKMYIDGKWCEADRTAGRSA